MTTLGSAAVLLLLLLSGITAGVRAETVRLPILVPITGFLSLEGVSQRNGALLAMEEAGPGLDLRTEVIDTGTTPEGAVTALERAAGEGAVPAVTASMLGTQMLAMLPLADELGIPLVTVSGTAAITARGSPNVFRFFPADPVAKRAHARFVVEELGLKRPALITQTTAYGQSGRMLLLAYLNELGAPVLVEDAVDPAAKDLLPVLHKALAADPDVLVLHLHSAPTALFVRQAAALGVRVPIVAGSAMHQPSTAALLEPGELKGVCAETASAPLAAEAGPQAQFAARYRARFQTEPDAFALGQYDGVGMVLAALRAGARSAAEVRSYLSTQTYDGVAMTYKSDGVGNLAHSATIICYDGASRLPHLVKRYDRLEG